MLANFWGFADFYLHNPILVLVLLAHVLSDFQLQSQRMADLKVKRLPFLILHLGLVCLPLLVLSLIFPSNFLFFFLVWLSHVAIDFLKFHSNAFVQRRNLEKYAFLLDQILHFLAIFLLYFLLANQKNPQWLQGAASVLQALLFFALIGKPVNIIFKLFFSKYQAREDNQDTIAGAGAMIGRLERLIMGLSLIFGQYASIGLVFTAKSIARYNKISESQSFAEYYLIGSLFSLISVLVCYGLLYF
ncbi:DUF3307 domain-containing protein [Streptococcus oricebi]|uniref:DUF3307 domain-containing protein n=1 Tax=Streptococcus oricebi TaxID=1547447 RepID=A0ABS5B0W0_9STRE|nr:DUF3307 domain-containing protein [Streptococcus oricebi]MBP2622462.1 DUF3307 domain-containing protein [Streptococcus oricebi]